MMFPRRNSCIRLGLEVLERVNAFKGHLKKKKCHDLTMTDGMLVIKEIGQGWLLGLIVGASGWMDGGSSYLPGEPWRKIHICSSYTH